MSNKIPTDLQWADLASRIKAKADASDIPTKTSDLENNSNFVADASYVHTDNNFTTELKNKLDSVNANAEENVIEAVKVNGTAQTVTDKAVDITVPTTAADVNALPNSTKYGASLTMSVDSSTYVVTVTLKDQDGNNLGTAQTIDLPLESVVVNGSYDKATKEVVLTLQNGSTIKFSVADLVSGLQTEITSTNMLSADLVDDSESANKFVTAAEKTKINNALTAVPIASASVLGGIKVGSNLSIDADGVLSATGVTLYPTTGQNTDGAMTQKAVTDALPAEFTSAEWDALWA